MSLNAERAGDPAAVSYDRLLDRDTSEARKGGEEDGMADAPMIQWQGRGGATFTYWIHPIGTAFEAKPGNYIYAREVEGGEWWPIYIGQTGDLSERILDEHDRRDCIIRNGATHIHVHISDDEEERLSEETILRQHWDTPCNMQGRGMLGI